MVSFYDIVDIIKELPTNDKRVPFLVSLAYNRNKYPTLTEKQEQAFIKIREDVCANKYIEL